MSCETLRIIKCDLCQEATYHGRTNATAVAVRALAKLTGWSRKHLTFSKPDVCPACSRKALPDAA